jgi:hypothetical protein
MVCGLEDRPYVLACYAPPAHPVRGRPTGRAQLGFASCADHADVIELAEAASALTYEDIGLTINVTGNVTGYSWFWDAITIRPSVTSFSADLHF